MSWRRKADFRAGEVELPHPHEARVIDALDLGAMGKEPVAPRLEGLRIMQAQDLDVGHQEAGAFDRGHHLGQGGDIAAGEDVLGDPRIGCAGPRRTADRMQHHHAVLGEDVGAFGEVGIVEVDADMLEHAD